MAEVREEVVEDIQIEGIIIQTYNILIVKSMVILLQIVHNTNLKTRMSFLLRKKLILKNLHYCYTWYLDIIVSNHMCSMKGSIC